MTKLTHNPLRLAGACLAIFRRLFNCTLLFLVLFFINSWTLTAQGNFGTTNHEIQLIGSTSSHSAPSFICSSAGTVTFNSFSIVDANANDFVIVTNPCAGVSLPVGSCCGPIGTQMTPSAVGVRKATLRITGNFAGAITYTLVGGGLYPFYQDDPGYSGQMYDHTQTTIGKKGCAMSSLSMALLYAGLGNSPDFLNVLMIGNDGFTSKGNVKWDHTVRFMSATSNKAPKYRSNVQRNSTPIQQGLDNLYPVIVGVNLRLVDGKLSPGHYVLVYRRENGRFKIVDPARNPPAHGKTWLDEYGTPFETRGYVSFDPPPLPNSNRVAPDIFNDGRIEVSSDVTTEILVANSNGLKAGYDPATQSDVSTLPNSHYARESVDDDVTNIVNTDVEHALTVSSPASDTYTVTLTGIRDGSYSLRIKTNSHNSNPRQNLLFTGNITIGQTITYQFVYRPTDAQFDFDGDSRSDISVFRRSNGTWYLQQSTAGFRASNFGISTDKIVPADYDGDGKTDVAVYRSGTWYLLRTQLGFIGVGFGLANDIPAPADYDGDGKADIAVFRPSTGVWYLMQSSNGFTSIKFGQAGDIPVAADYDGDGKADIAVYRSGAWYLLRSSLGFTGVQFGEPTDKPTPADYDGDGKADIAVFRPATGAWYSLRSQLGFTGIVFGTLNDVPAAGDYDGDGKADEAVFRPSTNSWYLLQSTNGFFAQEFGANGDVAVPSAFIP